MQFLKNVREGLDVEAYLISQGFNVSSHFIDFQWLISTAYDITADMLRKRSMDELIRSDIVYCKFGWEGSNNCVAERDLAIAIGKPIYYRITDLLNMEGCPF